MKNQKELVLYPYIGIGISLEQSPRIGIGFGDMEDIGMIPIFKVISVKNQKELVTYRSTDIVSVSVWINVQEFIGLESLNTDTDRSNSITNGGYNIKSKKMQN